MASPAQITEALPETLPGDFVEWDEASPSAQPVQSGSGEAGPGVGVVSKPATQAAEAPRAGAPSGNLPRGAALSVSVPENADGAAAPHPAQSLSPSLLSSRDVVVQLQAAVPAIDELRFSAPRPNSSRAAATMTEFHEIPLYPLRANAVEITRPAKKKWPIIAGASAALVVILAGAMIALFSRGSVPAAKSAAAPAPTITTIQQPEDASPTLAHSTLTVPASTAAATAAGESQINSEAVRRSVQARPPVQKNAEPSLEQAQMMDNQLHTPTRLKMKATFGEQAPLPPGNFTAVNIGGSDNSNAIGAVFGSPKQPRVQIASPQLITVPSGVALGLLIQKKQPVYPLIAKTARVDGTVVLAATISKTGDVENLRVVSGPPMLRGSAVDAVRTWRFKPYTVYNQPTAIETTINVHFWLN